MSCEAGDRPIAGRQAAGGAAEAATAPSSQMSKRLPLPGPQMSRRLPLPGLEDISDSVLCLKSTSLKAMRIVLFPPEGEASSAFRDSMTIVARATAM
mmetsp:Transcript_51818/g.113124  ORF Transcript_51818/g.113124 Transcript_51818/m.113124 type:complete len:97 (-) Transcript_51818:1077-1367(-)